MAEPKAAAIQPVRMSPETGQQLTPTDPWASFPLAAPPDSIGKILTLEQIQSGELPEAPEPLPAASPKPSAGSDPWAAFPKADTGTDPWSSFPKAGELRGYDLTKLKATKVEDLVKDKSEFNPVEFYAQNTDALLADPAALDLVEKAYEQREKEKLTAKEFFLKANPIYAVLHPVETAKTVGKAAKGGVEFVKTLGAGVGEVFKTAGAAGGHLAAGDLESTAGKISETVDAFDTAQQNWATIITTKLLPRPDNIRERLAYDGDFRRRELAAAAGNGELAKALGTDQEGLKASGVTLDPAAIQKMSVVVDPMNFVPIGSAIGVVGRGGKFLLGRAASPAIAETFAKTLNGAMDIAVGGAVKGTAGGAGKALEKVGSLIEKSPELMTRAGTSIRSGTIGAAMVSGNWAALAAGLAAPIALKYTGKAVGAVGRGAQAVAPVAGRVAVEGAKGAAEAAVLTTPLFIGSTPEEREHLLGLVGGAAGLRAGLAGVGMGAEVGARAAQEKLASKIFESVDRGPIRESAAYGTDGRLDAANTEHAATLPKGEQSVLNWAREFFRDSGVEIYALDNNTFQNHVPNVAGAAAAEGFFTKRGERIGPDGTRQPVVQVLLNKDTNGLGHELYHAFKSLDPQAATALETQITKTWTPEEQAWIAETYNSALNGGKPKSQWTVEYDKNQILEEAAAEVFGRVLNATDLSGVRPSIVKRASEFASRTLEKMGYPLAGKALPEGPGVSALGVRPGTAELKTTQDFLKDITKRVQEGNLSPPKPGPALEAGSTAAISRRSEPAKAPTPSETPAASPTPTPVTPPPLPAAPAAPATPVPSPRQTTTAPNIRVTPEEQANFAAERSKVTNADQGLKAASPEQAPKVQAINDAMAAGHAVEIVHKGVIREGGPTPEAPVARGTRRAEQEAAYVAEAMGAVPDSVREPHQKLFFGTRWIKGGKQLTARSVDKALANIKNAVDMAADKKVALPYETDNAGKLTEAGWSEAVQDLKDYWSNQDRGFRGDGQALAPETRTRDIGQSIPPEDPAGPAAVISPERTDFLNLVQGLNIPETTRTPAGQKVPGNVKGQLLAEMQGRKPATPAGFTAEDVQKATFKPIEGEISARSIKEVNPLRNDLRAAGAPVNKLIEVTENIKQENIESVTPRPDVTGKGGSTDITRGGFSVNDVKAEVARRLEEKRKAGVPITDAARRKTQQEVEFDQRNPRRVREQETGVFSVKPSKEVRDVAEKAAKAGGVGEYKPSEAVLEVNPDLAKRLADFYESAESKPNDPAVKASYDALIDQVEKQGKTILDAGYKIEPFTGKGEPYKSSAEMIADVRDNKHMWFLPTEGAFAGVGDSPMLRPSKIASGQVANDVFRWVHDFFGHAKEGYQFGPKGELNAWKSHSEMFTPEAQGALAAETLAQNSWVNYGKHLRDSKGGVPAKGEPGFVPATEKPFAEQKNIIVPDELISEAKGKFSVASRGEEILKQNTEDWTKTLAGFEGGLTKEAFRIGLGLTDRADLTTLKDLISKSTEQFNEAKTKVQGGDFDALDDMSTAATKKQFFQEAYEAATGTGGKALRERTFPGQKPPFEETAQSFSPATAKGKELAEKGWDFRITGELGNRTVSAFKNGVEVGYTAARQMDPKTAELAMTHLDKRERGQGVGEAMYRELFNQLQKDGVELVEGMVVAPEPLALRNKIFGGFEKLEAAGEPIALDEALIGANLIKKGVPSVPFPGVDAVNRITPEQKFSVRRKGEKPRETEAEANKRVAETDYSKYNVPEEAKELKTSGTGWFFPDKEFVPLNQEYHEQFLAENSKQLNEKYGTDLTPEWDQEQRLVALNKGFIRSRYQPANGRWHIEANADFWKGAKESVYNLLEKHEHSLDRLNVNLLDRKGQVVDQISVPLHELEGAEKLAAVKDALDGLKTQAKTSPGKGPSNIQRVRSFSVKPAEERTATAATGEHVTQKKIPGTPEYNAFTQNKVDKSKNFPEAFPLEFRQDKNGNYLAEWDGEPLPIARPYNLLKSHLAEQLGDQDAFASALANKLEREYRTAKDNPEVAEGEFWYSRFREKVGKVLGDDTKLFAELLGATSPQQGVGPNFKDALGAYNQFKSGAFDEMLAKYQEGKKKFADGDLAEFTEETGKTGKKATKEAFMGWWQKKHNLIPTKATGKKFGMNSKAVLKVLDRSWLEGVQGPKTPNFTGNLAGTTFKATIDVWAMRLLNRLANEESGKPWRIQPANETGVKDAEFSFGQDAFQRAADNLGIKADALQAILWFAEKDLWEKNDWTKTAGKMKSDYNTLLDRTTRTAEGKLEFTPNEVKPKSKKKSAQLDLGDIYAANK
jgi:predicted GNAT family acetyltransferase